MPPTIDDYHWLVSPAAASVLHDAAEIVARDGLVSAATKLRKSLSPERSQLVLQQCELRTRARGKFAHADEMFFTEIGLQQASADVVAQHKAARFGKERPIYDLCCGIGGDLLSLADRAPTTGFDRDEIVTLFAAANCQARGTGHAEVRCADVTTIDIPREALVHIDPDRRPSGRRTTKLEHHEPSDEFLESLFTRCAGGAIKLAPAGEVPNDWQSGCELEWISHQGECKQLVAWFGSTAANMGKRRATALRNGRAASTIVSGEQQSAAQSVASAIGRYVYEPDAAVIAARLVDDLAERHSLQRTAPHIVYLTGDTVLDDPLLVGLEVIEVLPFDIKRVKNALRVGRFGRLEVKKRGIEASPEELRRKLKVDGDEQATLILSPHAGKTIAIIARRMPSA